MSDTTDDMESYGYDGDDEDMLEELVERLKNKINDLEFGFNVRINALEKKQLLEET